MKKYKNNVKIWTMINSKSKFLISMILFFAISVPAFAGVEYDAGMNAYKKEQYDFAQTLFEKAIQADSEDVNARYMYAQVLVKQKKYAQAKEQYSKIIAGYPESRAAELSRQGIKLIDAYQNKTANANTQETSGKSEANKLPPPSEEPDYLKNAYKGGVLYTRPRGTTRIYIQPNSPYKSLAVNAFNEWQEALGSYVMFTYCANPQDAAIILSFQDKINMPGAEKGGITQPTFDGTNIVKSKIVISTTTDKGEKLPEKVIYHVLLHEIGHSIGIMGHSTDPNDIMYTGTSVFLPHLSKRDKNTARALYISYNKKPDAESVKKAKEEELKNIEKRISNDPSSFIELGDEYMLSKEYNKAIEQYKKAELLVQNKDIYYRLVKAYDLIKDTDNEVVYLKKILQIDKTDKTAFNNIFYFYMKERRYREAKTLLETFIKNNPDKAKDNDIVKYRRMLTEPHIKRMERVDKFNRAR